MSADSNIEKLITNIGDRYFRQAPPTVGAPIQFPAVDQSMTATRGMLIPQNAIGGEDSFVKNAILFQFNPETITYSKQLNYTQHQRLGYAYDIPFWVSGGAKTISFKLTLDGTAGSQFKNMIVRPGRGSSYVNDNNVPNGGYVNLNDYRSSPDGNGKGLLEEIAKFEALVYPMQANDTRLMEFNFGMAEVNKMAQFANPPYVLFSYGNVAANVFVTGYDRSDILFNKVLNPIRTELNLSLTVIEAKVLDKSFVASRVSDQNRNNS
jgi:hypothetical protein